MLFSAFEPWLCDALFNESTIIHLYLTEGSCLTMKAGCQIKLWYKVTEGVGPRYWLSFRKLDMSEPTTPELVLLSVALTHGEPPPPATP